MVWNQKIERFAETGYKAILDADANELWKMANIEYSEFARTEQVDREIHEFLTDQQNY